MGLAWLSNGFGIGFEWIWFDFGLWLDFNLIWLSLTRILVGFGFISAYSGSLLFFMAWLEASHMHT